jgi:CheY-like chemotaxis protein
MTRFHVGTEATTTPAENSCVKYWQTLMIVGVAPHTHRGFEMPSEASPVIVLLDTSPPVMNGWDAARHLNANTATKLNPVITLAEGTMMVGRDMVLGTC